MFDLEFYRSRDGDCPMEHFLDSLSGKLATKALQELKLLAEKGTELREPYSKALGKGLFELRVKVGSDNARSFYFFVHGRKIVVTNGFVKKTRRTPAGELERAYRLMDDWKERVCHE